MFRLPHQSSLNHQYIKTLKKNKRFSEEHSIQPFLDE
jgi:hypothetical protein